MFPVDVMLRDSHAAIRTDESESWLMLHDCPPQVEVGASLQKLKSDSTFCCRHSKQKEKTCVIAGLSDE